MILKTVMLGQTYEFKDVKELLAKASEKKSGDELAGVCAGSTLERSWTVDSGRYPESSFCPV